jgi:hypothetical protein
MQGHQLIALTLSVALVAGCQSDRPMPAPAVPVAAAPESTVEGTVVGDDRTAMEAAVDTGAGASSTPLPSEPSGGVVMNRNAPDSYIVKRGDTLWGIAKVFLRDPWFWPEIWQVNPKIQNPHLIYPGDTLRLVYIQGRPTILLQRGDAARVAPRVRSEPLDSAVTAIPYATVAAFMSKPSVLAKEQIKDAPYVLATRDLHVVMADGDTLYARGFTGPVELGTHYNVVRVGDALRDPDDNRIVGYDGVFTGAGHITRGGDPATLIMTESARETEAGDKLFAGGVDVPLDFIPSAPKVKTNGRIMAVSNGVTIIGQYEVVVINRGAADGLAPGNVLAVFQAGEVIHDTANKGFLNGMSRLAAPKVRLPDERTGTFMVFKTFEHLSYGLIMEATNVIRVADRVENP